MKKNIVMKVALIALYVLMFAAFCFAAYAGIRMFTDNTHEIEDVIEAIGDFAEEAWQHMLLVGVAVMFIRDIKGIAKKLHNKVYSEEKES